MTAKSRLYNFSKKKNEATARAVVFRLGKECFFCIFAPIAILLTLSSKN